MKTIINFDVHGEIVPIEFICEDAETISHNNIVEILVAEIMREEPEAILVSVIVED